MKEGASFDLGDAVESLASTWKVAGERRAPALVDMRGIRSQSREARAHFVSEEAALCLSAVALLVESPLSRMIGNFFLGIGVHRFPTQLFSDEQTAERWIMEQRG